MKICKDIMNVLPETYMSEDTIHEYMMNWDYFDELFMDLAEKYEKGNENQIVWSKVLKDNHSRQYNTTDKSYNNLISKHDKRDNCKKYKKFYENLYKIRKIPEKYRDHEPFDITEVKNMLKKCHENDLLEHRILWDFKYKYLNLIYKNYNSVSFSWIL